MPFNAKDILAFIYEYLPVGRKYVLVYADSDCFKNEQLYEKDYTYGYGNYIYASIKSLTALLTRVEQVIDDEVCVLVCQPICFNTEVVLLNRLMEFVPIYVMDYENAPPASA